MSNGWYSENDGRSLQSSRNGWLPLHHSSSFTRVVRKAVVSLITKKNLKEICRRGLDLSPTNELLIDESLIGWKEYEMEVVRDRTTTASSYVRLRKLWPNGIHTGDSITVAPAQAATDKECQLMRNASLAVLREGLVLKRVAQTYPVWY